MNSEPQNSLRAQFDAERAFFEARGGAEWQQRFVAPYYLALMGIGASKPEARELAPAIRERARELTMAEIHELAHMHHWREQVMGIWYAVARADTDGAAATATVYSALGECRGRFTHYALSAAVLTLPTDGTAAALRDYLDRSPDVPDKVVEAALRRIEPGPTAPPIDQATAQAVDQAEQVLDGLLTFAQELAATTP